MKRFNWSFNWFNTDEGSLLGLAYTPALGEDENGNIFEIESVSIGFLIGSLTIITKWKKLN